MDPHLFEAVPDALLIVSSDGRIARANGNAYAMFGRPPGTLDNEDVEALLPAELRVLHRRHRAEYLLDPHVRPMGASGQVLVGERSVGSREVLLGQPPHVPLDRHLACVEREALDRCHEVMVARHVLEQGVHIGRADDIEHGRTIGVGQGKIAHGVSRQRVSQNAL